MPKSIYKKKKGSKKKKKKTSKKSATKRKRPSLGTGMAEKAAKALEKNKKRREGILTKIMKGSY